MVSNACKDLSCLKMKYLNLQTPPVAKLQRAFPQTKLLPGSWRMFAKPRTISELLSKVDHKIHFSVQVAPLCAVLGPTGTEQQRERFLLMLEQTIASRK